MLPKINPTETESWQQLQQHFEEMKNVRIKDLFMDDPERFQKYSFSVPEIVFDFSKNIINGTTIRLLLQLADECGLREAIDAMFTGEKINETEDRSVLHTALRNFSGEPVVSDGKDVMPEVKRVLNQMKNFCARVHSGEWKGYT
ncbi:MAG: glucose-6-phosphate isomerase, partial [Ginsengibacter sp.]